MSMTTRQAVERADQTVRRCGSRDPRRVAEELGVEILARPFVRQMGAYKPVMHRPFIFIKSDLDPVMGGIVLAHELGHHCLHRREAGILGGFQEFNLFSLQNDRMEYEANIFAAQLLLSDEAVLECVELGYDVQTAARALSSDVNLLALKLDALIAKGYLLTAQHRTPHYLGGGKNTGE